MAYRPSTFLLLLFTFGVTSHSASLVAAEADVPSAATPAIITAPSDSAAINQQLSDLVSNKKYQQALQWAQHYVAEMEGDPTFDFHYGLSAAQTGAYNEAVFVFERLAANHPQVPRYRLELARCYFYLGQLNSAEREFTLVQASNPPAQVQQTIQQFLDRIQEKRLALQAGWFGFASLSGGYDSNINSATELENVDINLNGSSRQVRLTQQQRAKGSGFYRLRAQAGYHMPLSQRSGSDVKLEVQRKANAANDDYDLNSLSLEGGFYWLHQRHKLRAGGSARQHWLSGANLQTQLAINLSWNYLQNKHWRLFSKGEIRHNDNQLNDDLDATQFEMTAGPSYHQGRYSAQLRGLLSIDSSDDSPLARNTLGVSLSQQYRVSQQAHLYGLASWQQYSFQRKDPNNLLTIGKKRHENLLQLVAGYHQAIIQNLKAYAQISYLDNHSNIDIYQYDRTLAETGLSWSF